MKPSGVQLSRPIGPAWAADSDQLVGAGLVMRGEHDPHAGQHHVELAIGERQRLGVGLTPLHLHAQLRGLFPPGVEQLRSQVGGDHAGPGQGRGDGGVARSGGDVQHPVTARHPARPNQNRAKVRDDLGCQGGVVAQGPHPSVPGLEGKVGVDRVDRCGHFSSPGRSGWIYCQWTDGKNDRTRFLVRDLYQARPLEASPLALADQGAGTYSAWHELPVLPVLPRGQGDGAFG